MFKRKKPTELTEDDIERLKRRLMGIEEKEREEKDSDDDDDYHDSDESKYSDDGSIRSHENLFDPRPGFERPPMPVRSRADDERLIFPGLRTFIERNERIGRERIMQIYRDLVNTGEIDLEEHDPEFRLNILQQAVDNLGIPDVEVEDGFEIPVLRREPDRVARLFAELDDRHGLNEEEFRELYEDMLENEAFDEEMDDDEILRIIRDVLNEGD